MQRLLVEARAMNWKVAIVRAIHGAHVNAWSISELVAEYARMHGTFVTVRHADGRTETMTELRLRLEFEQQR